MAQDLRQGCWKFRLVSALAIGGAIATFCGNYAVAQQIVPDATLGAAESSVVTPNAGGFAGDVISGGATRGANLFHSFDVFSIPTGGAAFFNNAANIQNIISRVTGSLESNIDGLLQANGTANVFLLNPNGIVFGPNATLDIGGSFLASTASSLNFADGTQFSATAPQAAPLLTVSVPIGLQFGGTAGSIVNRSRVTNSSGERVGLQVSSGRTLGLVGGNVSLEGGGVQAPGGRVELGGVAGAGTVGLSVDSNNLLVSFPDGVGRADVYLTRSGSNTARVNVASSNGGSIAITARNIDISGDSELSGGLARGLGFPGAQAGDIDLRATGTINVANGYITNNLRTGSVGQAGNINLTTGSLAVRNGELSANTFGQGNAGRVNINARDTVFFDGGNVFSQVGSQAVGNGGSINITTGSLSVTNGAQLSALTFGKGDAGSVTINARDTVSFDGVSSDGIFSAAGSFVGREAVGNGGDINITTGSLSVTNGAQLVANTFGQGDAGSVTINARNTVSLDGVGSTGFPSLASSTVESGAVGNGGSVNVTTGSLSVTDGARLSARTFGRGDAGSVTINARDTVSFDGDSVAFSTVEEGAVGKGGGINITTGWLEVTNGAQLSASTFGQGDGGSVTINARNTVSFYGNGAAFSNVDSGAVGNGGSINIQAGSLSVTDGAQLQTLVRGASSDGTLPAGQGNAGNVNIDVEDAVTIARFPSGVGSFVDLGAIGNGGDITISSGSLSVTNGGRLVAGTGGQGDAGIVTINARDTVSFDGDSVASSAVYLGAVGNSGNINITTGSLSVTNGAVLVTSTSGRGDASIVNINARDRVSFDGVGSNGKNSGAFSNVEEGAVGNGGGINVTTGSLALTNGAQLAAGTRGRGDAGSVNINARDTVSFNGVGSGSLSSVIAGAVGNGGDITITTGSLSVTDGAVVNANTLGRGDAGSVNINARDTVSFDGVSSNGFSSAAGSRVVSGAVGNGGDINITTGLLSVTNGAFLTANLEAGAVGNGGGVNITTGSLKVTNGARLIANTLGRGNAGSVNINARDTVSFDGGSSAFSSVEEGAVGNGGGINITTGSLSLTNGAELLAFTNGRGNAGSVTINARDTVSFDGIGEYPSGVFSTVDSEAVGNGGGINITAESLSLTDGAEVSASTYGNGPAGNIEVAADSIRLDKRAVISSDTTAGQGNINLDSQDLVLRRGSNITTNATGTATGGNITIDTDVLAALENSDITANAQNAFGGRVRINASGIFGTEFRDQRTPLSDITASSALGREFSGIVEINTPDVDPTQGLVALPAELVDASGLIAQGCAAGDGETASQFTVTGRGGLPPNPGEPLSSDAVWEDARLPATTAHQQRSETVAATPPSAETANVPLVPATGWVFNGKGEVTLVAQAPNVTSQSLASTPATCRAR